MATESVLSIGFDAAVLVGQIAIEEAKKRQVKVALAIVDCSGIPLVQLRMTGAPLHSPKIAFDKAYTAISFRRDTSKWPGILETRSDAVHLGLMKQPNFLTMAGGLVVHLNNEPIGGIGVSGATEEIDEICAKAGLAALSERFKH